MVLLLTILPSLKHERKESDIKYEHISCFPYYHVPV